MTRRHYKQASERASKQTSKQCNVFSTFQSLYFLSCGSFYGTVRCSDWTASNDEMIHEWWFRKSLEESGRGLIDTLARDLSGGTEEILRQVGLWVSQNSNPVPLEYKATTLPLQ